MKKNRNATLVRPPERKALKKYWKKPVKKLSLFEQAEGKAGSET